jgi:hypothetical protein
MAQYIDKSAIVTEIEKKRRNVEKRLYINNSYSEEGNTAWERDKTLYDAYNSLLSFIDATEAKNVDLMMHTIIAECCDWLAKNTNLSHDKIEGCRNLMLTVKEEQFKTQKGK